MGVRGVCKGLYGWNLGCHVRAFRFQVLLCLLSALLLDLLGWFLREKEKRERERERER